MHLKISTLRQIAQGHITKKYRTVRVHTIPSKCTMTDTAALPLAPHSNTTHT